MSVLPVMSHHNRLEYSSNSSSKLRFKQWRVKLDRISRRQASSWAQQGKEWVRWLMRRKEDWRGLAVTWKQPCGNSLYASQRQTWSCWHYKNMAAACVTSPTGFRRWCSDQVHQVGPCQNWSVQDVWSEWLESIGTSSTQTRYTRCRICIWIPHTVLQRKREKHGRATALPFSI